MVVDVNCGVREVTGNRCRGVCILIKFYCWMKYVDIVKKSVECFNSMGPQWKNVINEPYVQLDVSLHLVHLEAFVFQDGHEYVCILSRCHRRPHCCSMNL